MADVQRIVVARDDDFADALASGVLQSNSPLMLVSPQGVQDRVLDHMATLGTTEVLLLGGPAALPEPIAQQLRDAGYQVDRRQGPTRIETAVAIAASDAPEATTAILVRAFASPDATDPTQAFADSLAAGGLAAENGWPVLLTQTDILTESTAQHLASSAITDVVVVGGTAAVSDAVTMELQQMGMAVQRIAGASRADTAVEIAKTRGAESAADVARVTLAEGQSADAWAGGFAAAAHSARFDAPIVLGTSTVLPPETQTFLDDGSPEPAFAQQSDGVRLTCVIDAGVCREAREVLDLPPLPEDEVGTGDVVVESGCVQGTSALTVDATGSTVAFTAPFGCPDLGHPDAGFAVVDVASGQLDYVARADTFDLQLSSDASRLLAAGGGGSAEAYDLTGDSPRSIGSVPSVHAARAALSADGATAGGQGSQRDAGDFVDVATGTGSGPDTCEALLPDGCWVDRPISPDGAFVYNDAIGTPFDILRFGRFDRTGASSFVEAPSLTSCTPVWPVDDGSAFTVCDETMLVRVDYDAGTSTTSALPQSSTRVTGATADGSLVAVAPNLLITTASGAAEVIDGAQSVTISADGSTFVSAAQEGLVLR